MEPRLLINSIQNRRFLPFLREQRRVQIELETLGDLVLEFDLIAEDVSSSPDLGDGEAVLRVGVLGLEVAVDEV
jgi:hypothetical protein